MAIKNTDIVLFQSQDNTDNDNGGGSRTSAVVQDGAVNNLFPDISRVDTVAGDVALRKVFPVVNTDDRDIYYGAHAIVRKPPDDPRVSALLFYTDDPVDKRIDAQSDVESYLIPSYEAAFYLFGSNIEGAKAVTFLQRLEEELPLVGDVYLLQEDNVTQYFRIADIEDTEVTLFYNGADYKRRRLIVTIDQPLLQTFTGSAFNPAGQQTDTCDTFATQVADAAKFYGTKSLTEDVLEGDTALQLDSIFEQLVPASKQQLPLINQQALQNGLIVYGDEQSVEVEKRIALSSNNLTDSFGEPVLPGSINYPGWTDDGLGNITTNSGNVFTIDYATGDCTYVSGSSFSIIFNYIIGEAFEIGVQYSRGILITTENQGTVYIMNVAPVPTNGSAYVDFRSGGKWYRISGLPDGSLEGAGGIGAGLVNNNGDGTATISVTLGRVPDLDSTVIFSWGSLDMVNSVRDEAIASNDQWFEWDLPHQNIDPSNCTIEYYGRGASGSDLLDFSTGLSQSDAGLVFTLDPINGKLTARESGVGFPFTPGLAGDSANTQKLIANYNYALPPGTGDPGERKFANSLGFSEVSAGVWEIDLGETIETEGVKLNLVHRVRNPVLWRYSGMPDQYTSLELVSDESGILREETGGTAYGNVNSSGVITIDFGQESRNIGQLVTIDGVLQNQYTQQIVGKRVLHEVNQVEYTTDSIVTFSESFSGDVPNANNLKLYLKLVPGIVGGFQFGLFESTPTTQNQAFKVIGNEVYQNLSTPEQIGTINRANGLIEIDYINMSISGNTNDMTLQLTNLFTVTDAETTGIRREVFKAGAADLVTSSFILRYTTTNGTFVATTNASGEFSGTDIDTTESYVDVVNGAIYVEFTSDINPEDLRFDCVAQTTLPLDPELLGLNPVRLPPDGKVPVFYPGAFVVVYNEETTAISAPTAGATETLARSGQAYIEVIDVNGQRLAYDQYTTDRDAGTVTFADPLNLIDRNGDPLSAPYSIVDRVEDMAMCTDSSVTGRISISAPLARDYTAGQTRVASALVWGDIGARVFNLFTQQSFDVWDDQPTTPSINAQFDNINFPIQINNKDSFTGRWACIFTSSNTVDVVSEKLGTILEDASIDTDIEPINPATGLPYFTIPTDGWGGGWVTSNVFRFNTESGAENMWIIRTVQSGALTEQTDSIDVEIRGDVN